MGDTYSVCRAEDPLKALGTLYRESRIAEHQGGVL